MDTTDHAETSVDQFSKFINRFRLIITQPQQISSIHEEINWTNEVVIENYPKNEGQSNIKIPQKGSWSFARWYCGRDQSPWRNCLEECENPPKPVQKRSGEDRKDFNQNILKVNFWGVLSLFGNYYVDETENKKDIDGEHAHDR